ncbi:molybdenum cofactor guanylyltransferase [Pelagibacterium sp.]|uniref:molybdenum cofactor guanylyltransferase n=1 Tax=Pelagibacterium sp. TaxID=1967288 RepID=UPI003A918845
MEIVGLILAGGEGRRLGGVRKSALRIGNRALIDWVANSLGQTCRQILVSSGSWPASSESEFVCVPDAQGGITGPTAGLLAGALWVKQHAPDSLMLSVSVDTPFWPVGFADHAEPLLGPATHCVVSAYENRDYPTNALWRPKPLIAHLEGIPPAPRGPRIRDVQAALGARWLDYGPMSTENPFVGVNKLDDLLVLSGRLAHMQT